MNKFILVGGALVITGVLVIAAMEGGVIPVIEWMLKQE